MPHDRSMTAPRPSDPAPPWRAALALAVLGGLYRAWLTTKYWGHEEEDWGNLVLFRGVLDSGFTFVETEHMPLYSWLAAAATAVLGDPRAGGLVVAVLAGALTVGLTTWIGARWLSPAAGLVAGFIVAVQPESALYAASTLRESTYTACMLGAIALVGERRPRLGGLMLGVAFLARFNPAFSLLPALLWLAWSDRRSGVRRWVVPAAMLALVTLLWAAYYRGAVGSWSFWGGVMDRNTGAAVGDLFPRERVAAVFAAATGLTVRVLPTHVGPTVLLLAPLGLLWRGRGRDPDAARWLAAAALGTLALLASTALVSTYEWTHNLYWKWLTPSVPFLALFAAHAAACLPRPRAVALALVLLSAPSWWIQTRAQVAQSAAWYGSQIELVRWAERAFPPGVTVITDAIPAWYLQATRSPVGAISWQDPALPRGDAEAFGDFLTEQRVVVVQWFAEEWVGAHEVAPWLEAGKAFAAGPRVLVPVAREDGYGFIAYLVSHDQGMPPPREPPPASAGALTGP